MKKILILISLMILSSPKAFGEAADVSGQVLGSTGNPVPGASVYLEGSEGTNVTITDAQGKFLFECVNAGSYGLSAHANDRSSERLDLDLSGQSIAVTAALSRVDSSQQVKIKARSLTASQADLAMTLELPVSEIERGPEESAQIGAALKALPQGSYEVIVSSPGMAYVGTLEVQPGGERGLKNGIVIGERDYLEAASQQASIKNQDKQNL